MQKSISRATRAGQSLSLQNNFKAKKGKQFDLNFREGRVKSDDDSVSFDFFHVKTESQSSA